MSTTSDRSADLSAVKRALIALEEMKARLQASEQRLQDPLAIVGVACRFPGGADTPEECWNLLRAGRDAITEVPPDRWDIDAYYDPDPDAPGKMSTRWGGFLRDIDRFDPELFGISPREAVTMDPQQRILLEVVWEALERAGQSPERLLGSRTGVFLGIATSDYAQILAQNTAADRIDAYFASGVAHSIASGRISYCLGLQGPSVSIDTACSSSLVAVYQASQSLRTGESDMAIAAGVNVVLRPDHGITFSKSRMMAPDGRCKTFDARADGFVRAEGCGVVILKRLRDAQAAGDTIMAVIRGAAINQDGASSGLTAPNGASQEALLRAALANGQLSPDDVGYIEAHGTGTSLGDPIEVRALGNVFGRDRHTDAPLLIGSVKTNFGHLESAAGITGLIKVVLTLMNREIPPSLHFQTPNPHIAWDELPIRVVSQKQAFPQRNGRRVAGVSSFGFSGTNAHILLEEAPVQQVLREQIDRPLHTLALSAKSEPALKQLVAEYVHHLQTRRDDALSDICHTAATGRAHFPYRLAVNASDRDTVLRELRAWQSDEASSVLCAFSSAAVRPKIGFLFTGQGSQYAGMGRELYDREPVFRNVLDRCAAVLDEQLPRGLLHVMFEDRSGLIDQTLYTQPALFALEVGLAQLWRSWGVEPALVLGHSVGEYAAACTAGVLSIEDGARLIAARARLMQALPSGGTMMAVQGEDVAAVERAVTRVADRVSIAARNAPGSLVISGDTAAIAEIAPMLHRAGLVLQPLSVSHAFHSPLMAPMLHEYSRIAQSIEHRSPQLGWVSNLTGKMLRWSEWSEHVGDYWSRHVREPVRFEDGIRTALGQGIDYFVEVGPHPVLAGLGRACVGEQPVHWLASLKRGRELWDQLLESLVQLYTGGASIAWPVFDAPYARRKLVLPTYPFQRERYWVETKTRQTEQAGIESKSLLGARIDTPAFSGSLFKTYIGAHAAGAFALDHRVFGLPVLPGTGFIAMAAGAAAQLLGEDEVELRELAFDEALPIPETEPREVQLVAQRNDASTLQIEIFSRENAASAWTMHSKAVATSTNALSSTTGSYDELRSRCHESPSHRAFYDELGRRGLDFGPLFCGVKSVRFGDRIAVGEIELPSSLHSEAARYLIHPVLLDACVQVLAAATSHTTPHDAVFLPVQIDVCRLGRPGSPLTACRAEAVIREVHPAAQALTADVRVSDLNGRYIASLEGIQLKRVSRDALAHIAGPDVQKWMIELAWRPEANREALETEQIAAAARSSIAAREAVSGWGEWAQVQAHIDGICRAYIADALRELGCTLAIGHVLETNSLALELAVKSEFRRLLDRFLQILAAGGVLQSVPDGWRVVRELPQLDADSALRALMQRHPAFSAELTFVARCGPNIAAALTGRCDPLQLLFPAGDASTAEQLYRDSPSAKLYNGIVSDVVAEIVARLPQNRPIRVLEIGGGTGSTTAHVLPKLPAERVEYLFTDISPLFVARAQERYASQSAVRAQPLDIERDPASQGLTGEFDIIIAANVLHATRDLADVFQRVRKMLSPNGALVALEITRPQDWIDISFGFTEGWWRFADAWRADYPLLTKPQWKQFLAAQGYNDVALLPSESQSTDPLDLNAVIIARAASTRAHLTKAARRWLVLADQSGVSAQLTEILERSGGRVVTAVIGSEYARLASGEYAVNSTRADDFVRLLQDASAALNGPPDGVVHLWCIDARLHRTGDLQALRERTSQLQGSLLHLGQALLKANEAAPALWVVTRGGVAMGDQPIAPLAAAAWGWARALRLEYPDWRCVSVDLDPGDEVASAQAIAITLTRDDNETQIAWRQRVSHVARLVRARIGAAQDLRFPDVAPLRLTARTRGTLDNLAMESLERAAPGPGQVEIRVRAAGLNFRDVLSVLDMYPGDQGPLGSECAGQVAAIGPGVDSIRVGDEVVAIAPGAFATHVIADAKLVVPRPRAMTCAEAAALPNVFLTAQWALERLGGMKAGDRVLIHAAAGGVGLAAIELARRAGAEIFATAGSDEKRAYLHSIGVRHIFSSRSLEFAEQVRSATEGRGVDLVLNSLAGDFIEASMSIVARGGVFLEIGRTGIWSAERVRAARPDIKYHTIDLGKDYAATPEVIRPMLIALLDDVASGRLQRPPLRTFGLHDAASAYRHMAQARHIGKLVLTQSWTAGGDARPIRENASYLVTGGLSGLGLATAAWLVERGVRSLVLMGRRAPGAEARKILDSFASREVQVHIVQGDVSSEQDIARLVAQLDSEALPPLAGIVHAAGSLDDGVLAAQSMDRYAKVFAAKVYGAWLIDRATRHRALDFVVFFSSAAGVLGSAGQTNHAAANAYLDALAVQLRAEGRPAISIQWGAWSQIGAAAGDALAARLTEAGLEPIAPAQGLKAFAKVMQHAPANIGVVSANWTRIAERWPPQLRSYAAELIDTQVSAPVSRSDAKKGVTKEDLSSRLGATPVKKRRALLQAEIRSLAMKVLSLPATHSIDTKAPLNGLGLDSLMAVELRNLLGRAVGRSLPATLLFDHPSIEALTSHLASLLDLEPQSVVAASSPHASGQGGSDLLDQVEQLSEEELDRLLAEKMKVH